jgi:hypothetical protein
MIGILRKYRGPVNCRSAVNSGHQPIGTLVLRRYHPPHLRSDQANIPPSVAAACDAVRCSTQFNRRRQTPVSRRCHQISPGSPSMASRSTGVGLTIHGNTPSTAPRTPAAMSAINIASHRLDHAVYARTPHSTARVVARVHTRAAAQLTWPSNGAHTRRRPRRVTQSSSIGRSPVQRSGREPKMSPRCRVAGVLHGGLS